MRRKSLTLVVTGLLSIGVGAAVYQIRTHSPKQEALAVFHKWEKSVENGDTGFDYWTDLAKGAQLQKRLFAVRACKVLAVYPGETAHLKYALVVARIDSSTMGGFPITSDWAFFIKSTGNGWRIDSISEN